MVPASLVTTWCLTYLIHSSLLVAAAAVLSRRASHHRANQFWRMALVAGLLTATVHVLVGPGWEREVEVAVVVGTQAGVETSSVATSSTPVDQRLPHVFSRLPPWGILLGVGLFGIRLVRNGVRARRQLGGRQPSRHAGLNAMLESLRARAGVRREVRLTFHAALSSPVALHPWEICLPTYVLDRLEPDEQESVLAHELAHLVRRDPLWQRLAALIEVLFFFQPLNHLAGRNMERSAEFLCDAWTVEHTGAPLPLARSLAKVGGYLLARKRASLGSSMARTTLSLSERVEQILAPETGTRSRMPAILVVLPALLVVAFAPRIPGAPGMPPRALQGPRSVTLERVTSDVAIAIEAEEKGSPVE